MRVLVTAGNTMALIDKVRCLTNIFTGRTGAQIAAEAHRRGHDVTLLTSRPETADLPPGERWHMIHYRTFEDLAALMEENIHGGNHDTVIHSAAVSDYTAGGAFAPAPGTTFDPASGTWSAAAGSPTLIDRAAGKIKSDEPELWVRLVRAPKLVDRVRTDWGFRGVLVKFKLEVGVTDERLLEIAEVSRRHSHADLMVANTLEGAGEYAFIGPLQGQYERTDRKELPARLVVEVEALARSGGHG